MKFIEIANETRPMLDIRRWGPNGWGFITACAFVYPLHASSANKSEMRDFLQSVAKVMPCGICRHHFTGALDSMESALEGRSALLHWINDTRNDVNKRMGQTTVSYVDMIREYLKGCQCECLILCTWRTVAILLAILVLCFLLWYMKSTGK